MSTLMDLAKKRDELQALVRAEGEGAVKEAMLEFFAKHPEVQALGWTQYTPYFNDGDECIFGVHDMHIRLDPPESENFFEHAHVYRDFEETYYLRRKEKNGDIDFETLEKEVGALENAIHSNGDLMKLVFGDHAQVIVTRDKIYVTEFNHD